MKLSFRSDAWYYRGFIFERVPMKKRTIASVQRFLIRKKFELTHKQMQMVMNVDGHLAQKFGAHTAFYLNLLE